MKRTGKVKWGNLRVGVLVTIGIAALLYSSFRGGGTSMFEPKNQLTAYFANVNGLVRGGPVWLGGVEVGNVKSVEFVNLDERRRIMVVFRVKESVWSFMTADSKVKLGTIGLLGDKYLEVVPGTKGLPLLQSGAVVDVLEGTGLDAMVEKVPRFTGSIDTLLTNFKDMSARMAQGRGTAGKLLVDSSVYDNLSLALSETTQLLSEIRKNQTEILGRLSGTLANAEQVTAKIDSGQGSLGRLINDKAVFDNLNRSTARLDSILVKLDRGDGTAGALLNDARLYSDIRDLIARVNNLVADIERDPRKYFKFSVF